MNISDAIKEKRIIQFTYHGHHRVVQPHTYGIDRKGHKALRGYQIGGTSDSGHTPLWRIFHEEEMFSLQILTEKFSEPQDGYTKGDTLFSTILSQL